MICYSEINHMNNVTVTQYSRQNMYAKNNQPQRTCLFFLSLVDDELKLSQHVKKIE